MQKTILIISTLNTKREETLYLKEQVESLGLKAMLMDISMRGDGASQADRSRGWSHFQLVNQAA